MPRRPRLFVPGAIYHVYCRVARGEFVFDDLREAEGFIGGDVNGKGVLVVSCTRMRYGHSGSVGRPSARGAGWSPASDVVPEDPLGEG